MKAEARISPPSTVACACTVATRLAWYGPTAAESCPFFVGTSVLFSVCPEPGSGALDELSRPVSPTSAAAESEPFGSTSRTVLQLPFFTSLM